MVFGVITKRLGIDAILRDAFGKDDSRDILSLAWYLVAPEKVLDWISQCGAHLSTL
jgi:hypothetical protein